VDTERAWARILQARQAAHQPGTAADRAELLDTALALACTVVADCAGCSVTEARAGGFHTPAASNALSLQLDEAQYVAADGPCVAACRDGRMHSVATMTGAVNYPGYSAAARDMNVGSSLSLPLPGAPRASALNVYAHHPAAFDDERTVATARLLARCVAALLPDPAGPVAADTAVALAEVEQRRSQIRRAEQVLADRDGATRPDAFNALVSRSVTEGKSIFDVARDVTTSDER
jgi:hypothetical protein